MRAAPCQDFQVVTGPDRRGRWAVRTLLQINTNYTSFIVFSHYSSAVEQPLAEMTAESDD